MFEMFLGGGLFAFLSTLAVRHLALRFGAIAHPNPIIPQHRVPVALLGGLGIYLGTVGAVWLKLRLDSVQTPEGLAMATMILGPSTAFLILGAIDDLFPFLAMQKLLLQLGAASYAVALGFSAQLTGFHGLDLALSVLWIVIVVNAVNMTDVCDGLVGGLAAVSLVTLALLVPEGWVVFLAAAGACVGFLVLNRPPATIFLGDGGSHLLGFLLAAGTLHYASHQPLSTGLASAGFVVAVPLFELCFLTLVRIHRGLDWWRGSPDHFSLRLQVSGMSRWQVDILAWSVAGVFGVVVVLIPKATDVVRWTTCGTAVLAAIVTGFMLLRWEVDPSFRRAGADASQGPTSSTLTPQP